MPKQDRKVVVTDGTQNQRIGHREIVPIIAAHDSPTPSETTAPRELSNIFLYWYKKFEVRKRRRRRRRHKR